MGSGFVYSDVVVCFCTSLHGRSVGTLQDCMQFIAVKYMEKQLGLVAKLFEQLVVSFQGQPFTFQLRHIHHRAKAVPFSYCSDARTLHTVVARLRSTH